MKMKFNTIIFSILFSFSFCLNQITKIDRDHDFQNSKGYGYIFGNLLVMGRHGYTYIGIENVDTKKKYNFQSTQGHNSLMPGIFPVGKYRLTGKIELSLPEKSKTVVLNFKPEYNFMNTEFRVEEGKATYIGEYLSIAETQMAIYSITFEEASYNFDNASILFFYFPEFVGKIDIIPAWNTNQKIKNSNNLIKPELLISLRTNQ